MFQRLLAPLRGISWLVRKGGLRRQLDYMENQLDHIYGLFDQWQARFEELLAQFEQRAQAVLPDVAEKQLLLNDKISQMNAGLGAREARLTKWLNEIEQNSRQILEDLKKHQQQVDDQLAQLRVVLAESAPEEIKT